MPIAELHWRAAYQHALRATAAAPGAQGLARLLYWPDIANVPEDFVAPIVRMCALLWRKPTASTLLARVLGADPAQTAALLHVLAGFGCVDVASAFAPGADVSGVLVTPATVTSEPATAAGSVVSKLWQRLLGR